MKAKHKPFVTKATALRKAIKDETLKAVDLKTDLDAAEEAIRTLQAELSEVETEGAEAGLSTAELHAAVDEKLK